MRQKAGAFSDHWQTKNNACYIVVAQKYIHGMNEKGRWGTEFCIMKVVLSW